MQTRPTAADIATRSGIDLLRMPFELNDYRISFYVIYSAETHIGTKAEWTGHKSTGTGIGNFGI